MWVCDSFNTNTEGLLINIIILMTGLLKKLSANLKTGNPKTGKKVLSEEKGDLDNAGIDGTRTDTSENMLNLCMVITSTVVDSLSKL